eukprot:scaffold100349_cov18-Tisochrysis_lutea.AAC.1
MEAAFKQDDMLMSHCWSDLGKSVAALTEHDARACKRLANRAHEMKEALRKSQSIVRHSTEAARRHNFEV